MAETYYGYRQCVNHNITTMHSVDIWRTRHGKDLRKVITTCCECDNARAEIMTRKDARKHIKSAT